MSRRVLIVDDSITVRQMISLTLSPAGYDVIEASDGHEALKMMNGKKIHLLITDLNMPNLDGIGLVKEVRRDQGNRFLPIIMLSTESDERKKKEGKSAGVSGWITKPFRPEQLLGVVKMLLK